jgi:hypothetical protein
MKKILFAILASFITQFSNAQITDLEKQLQQDRTDTANGWKTGAVINLSFTQSTFSNWNAGGINAFAANGLLNTFANYKKGENAWDNSLDVGYGFIQQNNDFIKTDDRIDLFSAYGRKAAKNWYYSGLLNFRTQMTDGFAAPGDSVAISRFMAPGYLLGAIGMTYKPNDKLSIFMAPITSKNTFVLDDALSAAGAFGVDPGKKYRTEVGGYIRVFYKKDLMENIMYQTKLDLFSNYLNNPQNIDVNWENLMTFKVNKWFSASVILHLIYDDDVDIARDSNNDGVNDKFGPITQFKQVLAIGVNYKLK